MILIDMGIIVLSTKSNLTVDSLTTFYITALVTPLLYTTKKQTGLNIKNQISFSGYKQFVLFMETIKIDGYSNHPLTLYPSLTTRRQN